jgi:hypothetical protein
MSDKPDYILEIGPGDDGSSENTPETAQARAAEGQPCNRPYISVLFECCGVYQRIYRNRLGDAYQGHCPKCLKPASVKIGPGGTSSRFFTAK